MRPGEIFVVMGLSGSGKSTLLRMLNGLLTPTAGTVYVDDNEITARLRRVRQERMSMVFEHFALLPHRTVAENAASALELRGVHRRTRTAKAREALSMVGLEQWADSRPGELSGGMKQRVGLARTLAADTDLLLMDEAFSALDPLIRRGMQDQLLELQQQLGKTIVFITHDLNEAMRLGDRVAVMRDGSIVQCGTPEQILTEPADDYVAQFLADVDRARVLTAGSLAQPVAVVPVSAGTGEAVQELERSGAGYLVVADPGRPVTGVLTAADLLEGRVRAGGTPAALAVLPAVCVPPDTPLVDLLSPVSGWGRPAVVADEAQRPLSVITVTALLAALAPGAHERTDVPAPRRPGDVREVLGV